MTNHVILARPSPRITVEEWPEQSYWRFIVAETYSPRCRQIRPYSNRSNALRAGRKLAKKGN
jgi:hypothetical protein